MTQPIWKVSANSAIRAPVTRRITFMPAIKILQKQLKQ